MADQTDADTHDVPSLEIVEPVYPEGSETSRWVTCKAEWDPDRGIFVNREAKHGWVLDDQAHPDSVYIVEGEEYSNMDDAIRAALGEDRYEDDRIFITIEPDDDRSPTWGSTV